MIFVFEISSPEDSDFRRTVHIKSDDTFDNLHLIIQDTSNFDHSQAASFFIADEQWHRQIEIGQFSINSKRQRTLSMYNSKLEESISGIGQKLVYVFDFFNDRFFYIELMNILMKPDLKEPFVAYEKGNAPDQFLTAEFEDSDIMVAGKEESFKSFGDLEDYFEIFGEIDV